ncbi:hypothetical protein D3C86_2190860 [compost metagenome]
MSGWLSMKPAPITAASSSPDGRSAAVANRGRNNTGSNSRAGRMTDIQFGSR